jgi:hypothetical protein
MEFLLALVSGAAGGLVVVGSIILTAKIVKSRTRRVHRRKHGSAT